MWREIAALPDSNLPYDRLGSKPVSLAMSKYFPVVPRKVTSDLCIYEYTP
jgi:hypothetical protein